tara:strand:+ start:675 stop:1112 length:438 start_codon:yes stop_codon:yes gene_type:complete
MSEIVIEETIRAGEYRQRRLSLTEKWVRDGVIEPNMHTAALRFASDFHTAQLSGYYATSDVHHKVDSSPQHADYLVRKSIQARGAVAAAMTAVGKQAGSVLWDVIGVDMSLREHINRGDGRTTLNDARGRLIVALEHLARYYGYG